MAILGIVGGIAPPSTVEYYRNALADVRAARGASLQIIVNSIDGDSFFGLLERDLHDEIVDRLVVELGRLERAGADLALIASNTGHIGFDRVQARTRLPLVGIVDATAGALRGFARVGLFATTYTVRADIYGSALARHGIACLLPPDADQERIQAIYFGELVDGRFRSESRDELLAMARRMRARDGVEAIVLGGTELPLLLTDPDVDGLPLVDTGRVHVRAAVDRLLGMPA